MAERIYVDPSDIRDAAEDIIKVWDKAFDLGDPPCPPVEVVEKAVADWLQLLCDDFLADADWYVRNSDRDDGRKLVNSLIHRIKQADKEGVQHVEPAAPLKGI